MSFVLAHLSDSHIGPLPNAQWHELLGKRLTGYINWRRGRNQLHDMSILDKIIADIKAQNPDHIAMTGDILNIALRSEFAPAQIWLRQLGDPANVSFVPGNHDAYTKGIMPMLGETFAQWTGDGGHQQSHYPYVRQRKGLALIGLSSAVPTLPFIASGTLGQSQLQAFAKLLDQARAEGLIRVVMIHHPPHSGGASFGRNLTDHAAFEAVIAAHGAELILHGHNHRRSLAYIKGPDGPVPIIGVASASAVPGSAHHRAAYHLYHFTPGPKGLQIEGEIRGIDQTDQHIVCQGKIPFQSVSGL